MESQHAILVDHRVGPYTPVAKRSCVRLPVRRCTATESSNRLVAYDSVDANVSVQIPDRRANFLAGTDIRTIASVHCRSAVRTASCRHHRCPTTGLIPAPGLQKCLTIVT